VIARQCGHVFIGQIVLRFERFERYQVFHVNALQLAQAGEFIEVLQHVFNAQIFAEEFGKGFLSASFSMAAGSGKALFPAQRPPPQNLAALHQWPRR
jgi:hypothetical protein